MQRLYKTLEEIAELLRQQSLQQKELLTFEEACRYLGFKTSYMYKLSMNGELPSYAPTGRKLLFKRSELTEWALRNRKATSDEINQKAVNYLIK